MDTTLVAEARKYLDKVDFIIDLYDNRFVWASDEILTLGGYTFEEFTKLRNLDTLDKSVDQMEVRNRMNEDLVKKHGDSAVLVNTKAGQKVRLTFEFQILEFNHGWYMACKCVKSEKEL
jgi:hypothetical protein